MLDHELFDKLEFVARKMKRNESVFGGIQLVCCGDFFQLPPIRGRYVFHSQAWESLFPRTGESTVLLRVVFRQQSDSQFTRLLDVIRHGTCPAEVETEVPSVFCVRCLRGEAGSILLVFSNSLLAATRENVSG
jgi:ATP-dependent DNA helicase PIF1